MSPNCARRGTSTQSSTRRYPDESNEGLKPILFLSLVVLFNFVVIRFGMSFAPGTTGPTTLIVLSALLFSSAALVSVTALSSAIRLALEGSSAFVRSDTEVFAGFVISSVLASLIAVADQRRFKEMWIPEDAALLASPVPRDVDTSAGRSILKFTAMLEAALPPRSRRRSTTSWSLVISHLTAGLLSVVSSGAAVRVYGRYEVIYTFF